jgi:hypothetical protein
MMTDDTPILVLGENAYQLDDGPAVCLMVSPVLSSGAIGYDWVEVMDTSEMLVPVDAIVAALKLLQPAPSSEATRVA